MTAQTDTAARKKAIIDRLMSLEEQELATAQAHYDAFLKDSQLDDREGHDKDDIAASRENADLAAAFDAPVHAHHAKIDVIENTDFSVTDKVQPGAVVKFNNRRFVVCVSTARFDVDGKTYMGISTQSPIYLSMVGLQEGDVFTHNGTEFEVQEVL
jgi:transcription elongation GreA/GreB family factor